MVEAEGRMDEAKTKEKIGLCGNHGTCRADVTVEFSKLNPPVITLSSPHTPPHNTTWSKLPPKYSTALCLVTIWHSPKQPVVLCYCATAVLCLTATGGGGWTSSAGNEDSGHLSKALRRRPSKPRGNLASRIIFYCLWSVSEYVLPCIRKLRTVVTSFNQAR